jgi:hypothetical protein
MSKVMNILFLSLSIVLFLLTVGVKSGKLVPVHGEQGYSFRSILLITILTFFLIK